MFISIVTYTKTNLVFFDFHLQLFVSPKVDLVLFCVLCVQPATFAEGHGFPFDSFKQNAIKFKNLKKYNYNFRTIVNEYCSLKTYLAITAH